MQNSGSGSKNIRVVVPGGLTTDIIVVGVPRLPGVSQDEYGTELKIGPGGKSRNIADMIAHLIGPGTVAMLSHTVRDRFGLWRVPYDALKMSGVELEYVSFADPEASQLYPAVALVAVDLLGDRNASIANAIVHGLTPARMDEAAPVFVTAGSNNGILALSLELPLLTADYAMAMARKHGLRIVLDPGGMKDDVDYEELFSGKIYLVKPNEHEAKQLTGVEIVDLESAGRAASVLMARGAENVLITHGEHGAYIFGRDVQARHITIPDLKADGQRDATGCGDQVMGALCAWLSEGSDLVEATRVAVVAGTMQFHRVGIQPVSRQDLLATVRQ